MLLEGSKVLATPRTQVWSALNDPAFLQNTIPGCRQVRVVSDQEWEIEFTAAVGPIQTNFQTRLYKRVLVEQVSYELRGEGSAGAAGAATGEVRVHLSDVEGGTLLTYTAHTDVSGRVAQLGARLIDSAARRFSETFFRQVAERLHPVVHHEKAVHADTSILSNEVRNEATGWSSVLMWRVAMACGVGSFLGNWLATWMR